LRAAAIEQATKERNLSFCGNPRDHLINIAAPFKFGCEAIESRLACV
jgi:hypothetical protein